MTHMITKEELINEFKRYLEWETEDFNGWESVEIFIGDTLSKAWLEARPEDAATFEDEEFKHMVDGSNSKWLEKESEDDTYKILLSRRYCTNLKKMTASFIHGMVHCLNYMRAVRQLPFSEYCGGNIFYNDWSEFKAMYYLTRYEYFSRLGEDFGYRDKLNLMAEVLGRLSADSTAGLIAARGNIRKERYFISRYVGASRAIRNLNMEEDLNEPAFHLWNMTPQYIIENYEYVFYLGNEWDEMRECALDATPRTYYYDRLIHRLHEADEFEE